MISPSDNDWMRRSLRLAQRGLGAVEPNPMVGAVLVRDGRLIGEGWHERFGGPHAEIQALRSVQENPAGSTLYVILEPCCHFGKTPPCTDALIRAGIRTVYIGARDPFPKVDGGGINQLRAAGIEVWEDVAVDEASSLLAPYLKRVKTGYPWVIAKSASTLDGKIATSTGQSRWITGEKARCHVHEWRGRVDAVAVGIGTALADDPMLTARPSGPRVANRVVFDRTGKLPLTSTMVLTAREVPVVVVTSAESQEDWRNQLTGLGVEVWVLGHNNITEFLNEAGRRGWTRVLVEGGGSLLGAFLDKDAVDELHLYQAPILVGGAHSRSAFGGEGRPQITNAWRGKIVEELLLGDDRFVRMVRT